MNAIQHRVTVGLFQSKLFLGNYCCEMNLINEAIDFVLAVLMCGILIISLGILFESCNIATISVSKAPNTYEVPLIYDPLAFVLIIFCNIVTVCNFLRKTIPSRQTIRSFSKYLEGINFLLLCCYPYLYNCNQFLILCSGDVELNPGPVNLKICHINIRSLSPVKLMAIRQDIADKFNIITLSETFLNRESSHNLEILGFHPIFRRDRGSFGGGVACYVGSNLVAKRRGDLESTDMECLWLEVRSNNNKFLLCTCYRPPDENYNFWDELQYMTDLTYLGQVKAIIFTGDFNADPNTASGRKLSSFANVNAFTLHIKEPTRITDRSSSILDQFVSNIPEFVQNCEVDTPLLTNDHCTVSITLRFKISKIQPIERLIWQYKYADFEGLNYALQNANWEPCFEQLNVDVACAKWNEIFLNLVRQYIPNKVIKIRIDDKPWYNSDLRKLSGEKNKVHRKAKRTNSPGDWDSFRRIRNQYTEMIREAASAYKANLAFKLNEGIKTNPNSW